MSAQPMKTVRPQGVVPHSRPWITEADADAIQASLTSTMVAEWEATRKLEDEAARYLGQAGGVATPDGTTALFLTLRALEIGAGDEVVIPTYVCEAVMQAVRWTGATPVLCDVGDDWCVNVRTVRDKLTSRAKAVVVVHTFGIVADTRPIVEEGVPVIEDLAQAFGAEASTGRAGGFGTFSITSFHATKCLTTGEGGMAFAREPELADRLHALKKSAYRLPLSDMQAALGLSQLGRYRDFLERRNAIAARYDREIRGRFGRPESISGRTMHYRYPILLEDGEVPDVMAEFHSQGVLVRRGVDALLHTTGEFPGAETAFQRTLSLPIHPSMTSPEVDRVIEVANRVLGY